MVAASERPFLQNKENVVMFTNETTYLGRRSLLGFAMAAAAAPLLAKGAFADTAPADATATIKRFNDALLAAMKAGKQTDFQARYRMLTPAVEQAFDLQAVLAVGVPSEAAEQDAEGIEHHVSQATLRAFARFVAGRR